MRERHIHADPAGHASFESDTPASATCDSTRGEWARPKRDYNPAMPLASGVKLGHYEIISPLGAGGMGQVYRARDLKLKRDVAIKVLPDDVAGDRERLARFQREAEALAALNHSN